MLSSSLDLESHVQQMPWPINAMETIMYVMEVDGAEYSTLCQANLCDVTLWAILQSEYLCIADGLPCRTCQPSCDYLVELIQP